MISHKIWEGKSKKMETTAEQIADFRRYLEEHKDQKRAEPD